MLQTNLRRGCVPAHAIGFDDAPFAGQHRGDVLVVGTIFSRLRLQGVVSGRVRRDGRNATAVLARLCTETKFASHLQVIMLQGIALGGFNVVDIYGLHELTGLPVIVVARRPPDFSAIERALLERVAGGERKWRLVRQAGPMEALGGLFVQRVGIAPAVAQAVLERFVACGKLPEPLRVAHLIAGGIGHGVSRGRA